MHDQFTTKLRCGFFGSFPRPKILIQFTCTPLQFLGKNGLCLLEYHAYQFCKAASLKPLFSFAEYFLCDDQAPCKKVHSSDLLLAVDILSTFSLQKPCRFLCKTVFLNHPKLTNTLEPLTIPSCPRISNDPCGILKIRGVSGLYQTSVSMESTPHPLETTPNLGI